MVHVPLQREQHEKVQSSSSSSNKPSTTRPWDKPFNQAMNKCLGKSEDRPPPTGRVHTAGVGARRSQYYYEPTEARKRRKLAENVSNEKLVAILDEARAVAKEECKSQLMSMMPALAQWFKEHPEGEMPNLSSLGSNSMSRENTPVPPPSEDMLIARREHSLGTAPQSI